MLVALTLLAALAPPNKAQPGKTTSHPDSGVVRTLTLPSGDEMNTYEVGAGRTVVLLPGMLGGAFTYRKLIPAMLADGYRVVIIDALGTGNSSRPPKADYTLTAQTERLAWAMSELQVSDAMIVGHALGAALALRLACRHPGLVRGVVALDGGQEHSAANHSVRRLVGLPFAFLFTPGRIKKSVRNGLVNNSADSSWVTDSALAGYTDPLTRNPKVTLRAFQAMGRSVDTDDICLSGETLGTPVLMLVGAVPNNSNMITASSLDSLNLVVPHMDIEWLPQAGHYIQEESPDVVAAAVVQLDRATATR